MKKRFSKKAKRHAAESKMRTRRMLKDAARRSGPVKVSYLPGFGPQPTSETKFPFRATINGEDAIVHSKDDIEYEDDDVPGWWGRYEQPPGEEFYRG